MASIFSSSPIQKLADSSSKKRTIAIQLNSLHSQASQELAAAESKLQLATEASFAASEHLKGTKKKDKEIKNNLASRFPVVRKKYAMLLANANTQLSLAKSDMASAKSAMVTLSKKVQSSKKKSEEANKAADEAEKNFQDAVDQSKKASDEPSLKDDEVVKETATAVGGAAKKQSSNLFRSIERTRDKSVDPTIERHVLGDLGGDAGMGAKKGVRQDAEEFAQQNPNIFRGDGLEADAARTMLEEAVLLAESSLKSTPENAGKILGRLKYLEKVAMDAGDDVVAVKILEIIKPVKGSLAKKSSFLSLLQKGIGGKIEGFKSHMIQSIPIIGGILESMRQKKKDTREDSEDYRDSINERISRGGQRGGSLDFRGKKSRGGDDDGIAGIMRGMGASPASELGGVGGLGGAAGVGGLGGAAGVGGLGGALSPSPSETTKSPIYEVLKNTYDKIVSIYELLHESIDPKEDALRDAESASSLGGKNKLDLGKKQTQSKSGGGGEGFFGGIFNGLIDSIAKIGKKKSELFDAAKAIAALGASLIPLAISLRIMKDVGFKTVGVLAASLVTLGLAGVILGKSKATMIEGALAIAALGAAMIPLAFALNLVKDVGFGTIAVLAVSLVAFGIAAAVIGQPSVLPYILLGALGIAALGASLIPLAFALNLASPAVEAFGGVISAVGQTISDVLHSFIEFADPKIGVGLLSAAIGIGAIAYALTAFGVASAAMQIGGAAAGLVSGLLGFFSGGAPPSAIEMLAIFAEFGKSAPLLEQAANAIVKLADALAYFSRIKEISTENLEALAIVGDAASKIPASSTAAGAITPTPSAQTDVGKAASQAGVERNSLADAKSTVTPVGGNQTSNNQTNNISNTNTNIHVSEGTRNTESTVKQMQREFY